MTTTTFRTLIEIPEFADSNLLANCEHYSIVGLETEHPILQVDGMLFEGSYQESLGTHLLFSQSQEQGKVKHDFNTTSKLVFRSITLIPKA